MCLQQGLNSDILCGQLINTNSVSVSVSIHGRCGGVTHRELSHYQPQHRGEEETQEPEESREDEDDDLDWV